MSTPNDKGRPKFFRLPTSKRRLRGEIDRELRFHIEGRIEELIAQGYTRQQAEREVTERFGDVTTVRNQLEEIDTMTHRKREFGEWRSAIVRDVRQALRGVARRPGFSFVVIATLALGIGAATAIYTLLDAVVLRPLPYPNAASLVYIEHPVPGVEAEAKWRMSRAGYFFFRRTSKSLDQIATYNASLMSLVTPNGAERVSVGLISDNFFDIVGVRPLLGRGLTSADNLPNAPPVVILGYDFWRQQFRSDASIVGKTINLSSTTYQVIGVAPAKLHLPSYQVQLWVPLPLDPNGRPVNQHSYDAIARLAPGVTVEAARAEASRLLAQLPEALPTLYTPSFMSNSRFGVLVTPLRDIVIGGISKTLWILLGAVGIVLLIACANVANLFLVRAESRRREIALRAALGADRVQLAGHYLAESVLLSMIGGVLAVALAWAAVRFLIVLNPSSIPRLTELALGWRSMVAAFAMALGAGLVFGLLPLTRLAATGADVSMLREGGRSQTASRRQLSARSTLVVTQMALAVVLLAAAGLMLRSFQRLRAVNPGLNPAGLLTFELSLPWSRYGTRLRGPEGYLPVFQFHQELVRRLSALPGVTSVGMATSLAIKDGDGCALAFVKGRDYSREAAPCVGNILAGPGYFSTLGIAVRGRAPTWTDMEAKNGSVVVSKAFADYAWPGEDPIGKEVRPNGVDDPWYRVVGVTGDVLTRGLDQPASRIVYYPMIPMENAPLWQPPTFVTVAIRTRADDPLSLASSVRGIVTAMDREVPVANLQTMETIVADSTAKTTFAMLLLAIAGGMALVLSAVGIYGVISYTVNQRRAEIGVRMALGANTGQVGRMVVAQSLRVAAVGIAIGLVGAVATTRVMQSLLFNVSPTDPVTLGAVTLVLISLGARGADAPPRRATKVGPGEVVRGD
jgi:putative ABC transport system permease protein